MILVLTVAVGGTLAYLVTQTDAVENEFIVQQVPIEVGANGVVTNISNTDDSISPDPGAPAYIRATVVANWVDSEGNVLGERPEVSFTPGENWKEFGKYYYYTEVVEAGDSTSVLMKGFSPKDTTNGDYKLSVDVLAQSIQARGADAKGNKPIELAWGVDIVNGKVTNATIDQ